MEQQQQLLHFCDSKHPLLFRPDYGLGRTCCGCQESVYGPSYWCKESGCLLYIHHKLCAELPLGLHHPLHPIHPLILSPEQIDYGKDIQFSNCKLCNESRNQYTYRCSRCDFSLHITCASVLPTLEAELHDHPLIPIGKWITFTCDLCGKEDKGMPFLCNTCGFWIHRSCAYRYPRRVKVVRHKHLLHLTHSSLEFHQPDSRFCQLCVRKVDTRYGLYYCSRCNFVAHLDCAIARESREVIDLSKFEDEDSEVDESIDSTALYKVKKFNVGEDGTQIAAEIKHVSHKHVLKLIDDEVRDNQKCYVCVRAILPPFYSCVNCSFFLHESCAKLPQKKKHPLHQHPLTLFPTSPHPRNGFLCRACFCMCYGFKYSCETCGRFGLDVQCSLISDILTHPGHEHRLILSSIASEQNCSCCDSKIYPIFRCTTCEFALDFRCATLPYTTRYGQHDHPFALCYTAEDDSNEYYCDICEEERDSKHWFYYCTNCSYPAHPNCILGKYPNFMF